MQLFAVACRWPGLDEERVVEALRTAAAAFPGARRAARSSAASSADGRLAFAAIAHPPERTAPRTYFARRGDQVGLYDGLPLPVYDAAELLERWDELELEGVFSALRIDLAAGQVEPRLDVFGMAKLFRATRGDGFVLSNSVEAVRLLAGATELDPVGVASMLGFGWAAGGRTLLRDVRLVEGPVTPRSVVPRRTKSALTAEDVARSLTELAKATAAVEPAHMRIDRRPRHARGPRARARRRARRRLLHERPRDRRGRRHRARSGGDVRAQAPARDAARARGLDSRRRPRSAPRRMALRASGSSPTGSSTRG